MQHAATIFIVAAGGPLKPSFGLSGAVGLRKAACLRLVRAFWQSTRIQFPRGRRSRSRSGENCPTPVFGTLAQSRPHRVAMDVARRFHELLVIPNVAIVVALLPEVIRLADQPPRHALLQGLDRASRRCLGGLLISRGT